MRRPGAHGGFPPHSESVEIERETRKLIDSYDVFADDVSVASGSTGARRARGDGYS